MAPGGPEEESIATESRLLRRGLASLEDVAQNGVDLVGDAAADDTKLLA